MRHQIVPLLALTLVLAAGPARPSRAQWHVDGAAVCTAANDQFYPKIVSDGGGGAIVTWQDRRSGTSYDIYAQRVDAAGVPQWIPADGVALCTAVKDQYYPAIVSDGAGGAIVTWKDYRSGTHWGIYARRVDAAGVPQWADDGVVLCATANDQWVPRIASDGAGGAIVTWEDHRGTYADIYAQRVDAAGTPQWNPEGVAICAAPNDQESPTILADGAGGAIATWQDGRTTGWDIYAQRVDAAGVPQWTADGVALCTALNGQLGPTGMLPDGAGGAIVTWDDLRNGSTNSDIFAQHLLASGAVDPAWTADGVPVCTAPSIQQLPTIVSDGTGGGIVTWEDNRSGTSDIYARHVLVSGAMDPAWAPNGVALCTAAYDQRLAQIISDGAGGAIVTWADNRNWYDTHIYAQHVLASGAVDAAWTADGVPVCTAANVQYSPTIASDGAGGAIVAWYDYRSGTNWDIYAQRVYGAGAVATVPPLSAPAHFQLLALSPNPAWDGQLSIRFKLSSSGRVSAQVLDLTGHRVRTLATEREFSPGTQVLGWDGRDQAGVGLPSGVYFVEVHVGGHSESRRAVLLH